MEAADGSLHCASHFKHKEGGTLPPLCQVRCIVLQGEFGTRKGKNNVVFKGMLTTLNVSKLASRRQCKFCTDLSLNSGEGESSLFPKHVRNQFKTVYKAQWHPVQCIYEFSCCVSTHFCCCCSYKAWDESIPSPRWPSCTPSSPEASSCLSGRGSANAH